MVHPGDIIVGDADGLLIISPENAEMLAQETEAVEEKEAKIMEHILQDGTYERPWVWEILHQIGVQVWEGES